MRPWRAGRLARCRRTRIAVLLGLHLMGSAAAQPAAGVKDDREVPVSRPTAQITILVFEDNQSINGAYDQPAENGLKGFQLLFDAAGQALQDAWTNPIGSTYLYQCADDVTQDGVVFHRPLDCGTGLPLAQGQQPLFQRDGDGLPVLDFVGDGSVYTCPGGASFSAYTPYQRANCVDPYTLAPMAAGEAVIRYIAQNKFTVEPVPPHAGIACGDTANSNNCSDMLLTATLEGTRGNNAWVRGGEPRHAADSRSHDRRLVFAFAHPGGATRRTGQNQPREVVRPSPLIRAIRVLPARPTATRVLELAPAPPPSSLYDGLAETQALRFDASGQIFGTCLYWSLPRYVGRTPVYESTMQACTWNLAGAIVGALPCAVSGCETFQYSPVVAPPNFVVAEENASGTAVGWRFGTAASSPYATWADVQAIEIVDGGPVDLFAPNWLLRYAFGVDDRGDIIGYGRLDGHNRGFLILPLDP